MILVDYIRYLSDLIDELEKPDLSGVLYGEYEVKFPTGTTPLYDVRIDSKLKEIILLDDKSSKE